MIIIPTLSVLCNCNFLLDFSINVIFTILWKCQSDYGFIYWDIYNVEQCWLWSFVYFYAVK